MKQSVIFLNKCFILYQKIFLITADVIKLLVFSKQQLKIQTRLVYFKTKKRGKST